MLFRSCLGAAEDSSDVLGGDGESGEDGIEVELEVDDRRENGHGEADSEVAEENLQRGRKNPKRDGARGGRSERGCGACGHRLYLW